jgi:hypothetical protein
MLEETGTNDGNETGDEDWNYDSAMAWYDRE